VQKGLILGALLALAGCGTVDVHHARNPFGSFSGMSVPDLLSCMGKPTSVQQTAPDIAILQYDRKDTSAGFKASLAVLGSIQVGGGGGCSAVATISRTAVYEMTFPGSYEDSLFSVPYSACASLIHECLAHFDNTQLPPGYDGFAYLLPKNPVAK
jgi:hypothetical protein